MASGNAAAERRFTPVASSHKTCNAIERNLSSVALDNYDWLTDDDGDDDDDDDDEEEQEQEGKEEGGGENRFM